MTEPPQDAFFETAKEIFNKVQKGEFDFSNEVLYFVYFNWSLSIWTYRELIWCQSHGVKVGMTPGSSGAS